ncbi:MAG: hypothetical protein K5634_06255, partial [Sphaerochaetaceae bacterium]|nr:hypothetical protein [Sphaerochaetaceae bacterium]
MKRFLYAFALTVFVFLSSCSQEAGTATMRILLYQEEQKTISVSESAFDITKYTVTGTGPGGSSFTADTTSTSLVMEGLQTGSWTLKATGFNSRGKAVAGGEVTSQFESDSSNISLPVSRIKGTGKLVVSFSWDEAVSEPVITVSLRKAGSVQAEETEYSFEGSSGTVRITGLDSGFYVFKVSLSSRGSRITGLCEAVQISGDETTEASISFCSKADYPKALGELYISRSGESPVRGHLSRSGNTVVSGSTQSVRLELTGSDLPDLSLTWFMDGEEIEGQNGGTLEFLPCSGWHIINAVIVSPSLG